MVDRILIFASTTMIILKVVHILRDIVSESFSKNVSRARIYIWSLMGDRLGFLDSQSHSSLPLRTLPLYFVTICIAYPIRTLPIKYGCILLVRIRIYPAKRGMYPLAIEGEGTWHGCGNGEYIPDEDETEWQTANRMSWPLRFALSRLCIRSTLASPGVAALVTSTTWFLQIFVSARLIHFLCPLLPDFSLRSRYTISGILFGN